MIKNFLKIAFRNMIKNKFYSLINIFGLSIGMVCFILIALYIMHEWSYDRYHRSAQDIYRVVKRVDKGNGAVKDEACCPSPLGDALKLEYPGIVKKTARFFNYWGLGFNIQYKNNIFNEVDFTFVDAAVFEIFDFEFVKGNPQNALDDPFTVVITESTAEKYFGKEDPIGRSLKVNEGYDIHVIGVIKDIPSASHFHFNFLTSYATLKQIPWKRALDDWYDNFCYTYILLGEGISPDLLNSKFPDFTKKFLPTRIRDTNSFYLQPLVDIHLKSGLEDEFEPGGSIRQNYLLLSITVFILMIAAINYINLAAVSYTARIKEIGIRKIMGSQRFQLVLQFIGESTILCFLSLLLSLVIIQFILPQFSGIVGKKLSFSLIHDPKILVLLGLLGVLVSIFSGAYPAFYVSSFQPAAFLGKWSKIDIKKGLGRRILVVSQLVIAALLIIGTMVIHQQLKYIDAYDVKYDKDNIIILPVNQTPIAHPHYDAFLDEITQQSGVINAAGMRTAAGYDHITEGFAVEGFRVEQSQQMIPFLLVRHHFSETFGIEIAAGRDFSKEFSTDETEAILINETMAKNLGWKNNEAIGKILRHGGWGTLKIIGVVKDFNFESLHSTIKPLIIKLIWPRRHAALTDYIAVRISPEHVNNTLRLIGNTWKKFAPNSAFEYVFLDKKLAGFYKSENTLSRVSAIFTIIAVVIACLGLLGLISFMAESKTKEIAVRKTLGASISSIVRLISREFVILILIANVISWPVAYRVVNQWLQNFAYRIDISVWIFVLATVITFFTSFLAIWFHTIKAAYTNPVDYLRYE
jgi:putative ABC transport system permease protein